MHFPKISSRFVRDHNIDASIFTRVWDSWDGIKILDWLVQKGKIFWLRGGDSLFLVSHIKRGKNLEKDRRN
jgi:hypothetical protein